MNRGRLDRTKRLLVCQGNEDGGACAAPRLELRRRTCFPPSNLAVPAGLRPRRNGWHKGGPSVVDPHPRFVSSSHARQLHTRQLLTTSGQWFHMARDYTGAVRPQTRLAAKWAPFQPEYQQLLHAAPLLLANPQSPQAPPTLQQDPSQTRHVLAASCKKVTALSCASNCDCLREDCSVKGGGRLTASDGLPSEVSKSRRAWIRVWNSNCHMRGTPSNSTLRVSQQGTRQNFDQQTPVCAGGGGIKLPLFRSEHAVRCPRTGVADVELRAVVST